MCVRPQTIVQYIIDERAEIQLRSVTLAVKQLVAGDLDARIFEDIGREPSQV